MTKVEALTIHTKYTEVPKIKMYAKKSRTNKIKTKTGLIVHWSRQHNSPTDPDLDPLQTLLPSHIL